MKKAAIIVLMMLLTVPTLNAANPGELFGKGISLLKQGEFQNAIDVFSQLIELEPENPDAYRNRGVAYMKLAQYDAAISDFESALKIRPEIKGIYSNLGVAWYYKKEYQKAITYYDKEIELKSDNHYAYFNRALCRAALEQLKEGLEDVKDSLRLYPNHYPALCLKGDLLAALGNEFEAMAAYEKAIELNPKQEYARKRLAGLNLDTLPDDKQKPLDQIDNIQQPKFALQSGGFKIKENANEMIEQISDKGFSPRLLELTRPDGQQWYLVRLGGYETLNEAETALEKSREKLGVELIIRPYGQF